MTNRWKLWHMTIPFQATRLATQSTCASGLLSQVGNLIWCVPLPQAPKPCWTVSCTMICWSRYAPVECLFSSTCLCELRLSLPLNVLILWFGDLQDVEDFLSYCWRPLMLCWFCIYVLLLYQQSFNTGDYVNAILSKQRAETISSVLYPDDRTYQVHILPSC